MPCYHPLDCVKMGDGSISFRKKDRPLGMPLQVPCGQCIGCRLERSRQWAMRCMHEAQLWQDNCFVTLTYDEEHLPADGSLNLRHFQLFMKRMRKACGPDIRFFHCGEYGDLNRRPHYHAILFNKDFKDKKLWKITKQGHPVFVSEELSRYWQQGFCLLGAATFQSAAYVARYIMKKVTGQMAQEHYLVMDQQTGELLSLRPEYVTMSRRPGIGREWLKKYRSDVYPSDEVVVNGVRTRPPKFYDRIVGDEDPLEIEQIKFNREERAEKFADNNTPERLAVREKVQEGRLKQLKRSEV